MKTHRLLLVAGLPLILIFSCTVQKRVYRPGYHVEWRSNHPREKNPETTVTDPVETSDPVIRQTVPVTVLNDTTEAPVNDQLSSAGSPVAAQAPVSPVRKVVDGIRSNIRFSPQEEAGIPQVKSSTVHHSETMKQSDSRNQRGLLLAPLRIIFTIAFIVLAVAGLLLLFVLESALGGTVLLAAGAVLLILLIL